MDQNIPKKDIPNFNQDTETEVFKKIMQLGKKTHQQKFISGTFEVRKQVINKAQENLSKNLTEATILTEVLADFDLAQRLTEPEDWMHLLAGLFSYVTGL